MNQQAKPGHLWVCMACGRTSDWKYGGYDADDGMETFGSVWQHSATRGWDISCMMRAVELPVTRLVSTGNERFPRVREILPDPLDMEGVDVVESEDSSA